MKKRKIFAGLNTTISVLLVLALACSVYYIAERHPIRKDFTADKFQTLSPKTLKILKGLDADVTAVVFIRKDSGELSLVSDALREYARNSNRFKYKAIDPVLNPAEVRRYSISREGIVFVSGGRQKFVSKDDIFTFHPDMYGGQSPPEYAGEAVFTNAIVSITGAGSTVACFTVGHGERDINGTDEQGYSAMRDNLVNSNYEIRRIELSTEKKVSERCDVVGVLGPTKFFSKPELDALDVYLSGGGHVLFLVDPVAETGLNAILE
ncbi:MAG TPA: GldG family protein, partial [bacterium]|nr:GldG family protein [bacterium]